MKEGGAAFRSDFVDRLTWLLNQFPTRSEAAAIAGVTTDMLAKYVRHGTKPPPTPAFDVIARLCVRRGVSIDWLWTGAGRRDDDAPVDDDHVRVPIYDIRAGLGSGQTAEDETPTGYFTLPKSVILAHGMNPAGVEMGRGIGDSMRGTIEDGDPMLWDRTDREARDKVFLMRRGGQLVVKRLQLKTDGTVILKSDNPAYEDEVLPRDEADSLEIIGRVGMVLRSI
ncbi:MAG: S24 family peptidase [Rhizomicrobium sp.]